MNNITINGQTISIPAGMSVNLVNGTIQIVPVQPKKTVHIDKHGQKVNTKAVKAAAKKSELVAKKAISKAFYSKENLQAIKDFFIAKNGITTDEDVSSLAENLGVPAGLVADQFRRKSLAVCYGSITLPNLGAFLSYAKEMGWRVADLYNNKDIATKRAENLSTVKA
jgi:hypothetical protein